MCGSVLSLVSRRRRKNANDNKIRTRRRIAVDAEPEWGWEKNIATRDIGGGDHRADGKHNFHSDGERGGPDTVWARNGGDTCGRNPRGQSTKIGAKTFRANPIGERKRQCAVE